MTEPIPKPTSRPGPRARATRRTLPLLVALTAVLLPAAAAAQIADAWLHGTPISTDTRPFSARLEAMGGLEIAIEEEQNRINPFDHSGNPAGLFADQDSSGIEQYSRYDQARSQYYGLSQSAERRGAGARVVVKSGNDWSLAIDGNFRTYSSSQHDLCPAPDGCRFIRDFNLPYPGDILPTFGDRTIGAQIEAPQLMVTYSRPFLFERLTLGGRFGFANETEARRVPVTYPIHHDLNAYRLEGGALYDFGSGALRATVGGHIGWSSDKVEGTSEGPLNDDHYDWARPSVWYGGQALVRYGSAVRGILDARHRSFDGEMVARINWAPQYYLNPLPSDNQEYNVFKQRWSALLSGLRRNEAGMRWLVDVKGTPVRVSAAWRYYREYEWLRPNLLVLTIGRPLDVRRLGYRAAGGLSVDLPRNRGVVAAEVHVARDHRRDLTGELAEIEPEDVAIRFGAEYRPIDWLPLRGGVAALRSDSDLRDGQPFVRGTRLTAGLGYDWAWLRTHLDLAWAHEHWSAAPGAPSGELRTGDALSLAARFFF